MAITRFLAISALALPLLGPVGARATDVEAGLKTPGTPGAAPKTVLTESQDFDRSTLMAPGYQQSAFSGVSFLNPNRFSMRQSYSLSMASGSLGTASSGLYLNTLSYQLANSLVLSADVGFHMPLYSTVPGSQMRGFQTAGTGTSLILPHVGLEYKPSKNASISVNFFNGPDAAKAYGYPMGLDYHRWNR